MNSPTAIWFTGLSGSGKTTLGEELKHELEKNGFALRFFDGDIIRRTLNKDLGFTLEDRRENIRRVAEVNRLFLESGFFTINAFITPTEEFRTVARSIIDADRFFQIYLNTPVSICIKRDPKGLYKKAMAGAINGFTGVNSPFEECKSANLIIDTSVHSVQSCIQIIMKSLQIVA